jgi:hypothetical protein
MGGTYVKPSNRAVDQRNKAWLDLKEATYPYRWTMKHKKPRPEEAAHLGINFIAVPFPGKNQTVWGFNTFEDMEIFKKEFC